jgi:hypothetical protein
MVDDGHVRLTPYVRDDGAPCRAHVVVAEAAVREVDPVEHRRERHRLMRVRARRQAAAS